MTNSSANDCIFCKIIDGKIPAPKLYEDENFICIKDIQPKAPIHLLVVPKTHIPSLDEAFPESGRQNHDLVSGLFEVGVKMARAQKLLPGGFRTIINTGKFAGQTVFHIHLHVLGGKAMNENFG